MYSLCKKNIDIDLDGDRLYFSSFRSVIITFSTKFHSVCSKTVFLSDTDPGTGDLVKIRDPYFFDLNR